MTTELFKNTLYFGTFLKRRKNIRCTITNMLLLSVIDINGKVLLQNLGRVDKGSLWVYIYYIWKNNRFLDIFKESNLSNAHKLNGVGLINFVKYVQNNSDILKSSYFFFTKKDLAIVCNSLLDLSDIHIPIINETLTVLEKLFTKQEESLHAKLLKIDPDAYLASNTHL